jgi:bifunctional enzyme CysN/CysC/sulfate adenylyltransferase subunit 1
MISAPEVREGFEEFLQHDLEKELLRFTTAGSVDDGKSTLIGRLLHDAKGVYEDQLASVKKSRVNRSTGPIDFSLLTDGLRAEREQGITIDVAYRYFQTPKRKFIIADTPGHEQYTRNMATGASTANLAVILVDGTKGLLPQTRRHSYIAALLGIPNVLVAINKMDLIGYQEEVFLRLQDDFLALAERLKILAVQCVPVSALEGDNVVTRSRAMTWYSGPTLLEHLEGVPIEPVSETREVRFPVQYVIRPDASFRGFAGQVAGGILRPGDSVLALPSGRTTRIQSIVTYDGELNAAFRSQSVTVTLEDEIDLSRGDMLVSPENPPSSSQQFSASVVWLHEKPLELNRTYLLKHTTRQVKAKIVHIQHRVDVNTLTEEPATGLAMNGIALVEIEVNSPLFFDSYIRSRATGSFILIDPLSNATVGAGMIRDDLSQQPGNRASSGVHIFEFDQGAVSRRERFERHGHLPAIFLLQGLRSHANALERALFEKGFEAIALDGDSVASPDLVSVLKPLWSVGYIVIYFAEKIHAEVWIALAAVAGSSPLESGVAEVQSDPQKAVAHFLSRAELLRIGLSTAKPGEVD